MAPSAGAGAPPTRAAPAASPAPAAQTLPRARRIRKRAEFVRIQQSPARVTTRNLLLLLALRKDGGPARLGVVASKKVGPAVARNRAKRLVREAFRTNPDTFPPHLDVVIVVRPGTQKLGLTEIAEQLRKVRPLIARRAADLSRDARAEGHAVETSGSVGALGMAGEGAHRQPPPPGEDHAGLVDGGPGRLRRR